MSIGDADDILARVKRELPARWFAQAAPIRDAILGGLSDLSAWLYSVLYFAYAQMRIATASGASLDLIAYDFLGLLLKRNGTSDDVFRARIRATILQERVTRAGMVSALEKLTGATPIIFEPWNTGDAGGWDTGALAWAGNDTATSPGGGWDAASGWDANAWCWDVFEAAGGDSSTGAGAWGAMDMPGQVLIAVHPQIIAGVPNIGGWDAGPIAWDGGGSEWVGEGEGGALTEQDIYDQIRITKPTGVIAWVRISGQPVDIGDASQGFDASYDASYS